MLPHQAGYDILDPGGVVAGQEALRVQVADDGWLCTSVIETEYPASLKTELEWWLAPDLRTRVLHILSRADGDQYELELAVTGNGVLAHRSAPDGPTQVELGWGDNAELDHLSALFPSITLARAPAAPGRQHRVQSLHIDARDLSLDPLLRDYETLGVAEGAERLAHVACTTVATGHVADLLVSEEGVLHSYAGLLRLSWVEPTK